MIAAVFALTAVGSVGATHIPTTNNLGRLSVRQPCCGGAALQGSRATIRNPSLVVLPFGTGALSSISVEGNADLQGGGLMQVGIKQSNAVGYDIATCEQSSLSYWAEIFDQNGTRCYFLGSAAGRSITHRYSLQKQSGSSIAYQVFLDGVAPGGRVITGTPSVTGNVGLVGAGVEITRRTTSSESGLRWDGYFAGNGNTRWQRWNGTLGWVTINHWTHQTNGGGWNFSLSSFPTIWSVSR